MSFIHLNTHSHYSKGWGIPTIEALCAAASEMGMKQLALTDTNGLYGLVFFVQAAREAGIAPIVGSELVSGERRALLLIKNPQGYANLSWLISARQCHQDFDLIRALRERRDGLVVLSDDFKLLKTLKRDSMDDLYVEMSPGFRMAACYAFSRKSAIPPVATNRVFLITKDQFPLHRILRAVSMNTKLSRLTDQDTCREHNDLNAPRAMIDQFPHAPEAVANTLKIAERCFTDWDFNQVVFPRFEKMSDEEAYHRLYEATMEGCKRRYGEITQAVRDRVAHEMRIIREKNFAHYFLVVADITRQARRSCGRGSAAASIVSYALEITHVDPIRHNLFFERFLNLGRKDPPDIDVDFAWDERDQVIDYVFSKYGNRRAAMVANHNTFAARAAVREVAKVFGLTEREIGEVTGRIGFGWHLAGWKETFARHPRMRGIELRKPWSEILEAAERLENHFNHLSTHCGGLVLVPDEIRRYCPVEISAGGVQVLQWEKDSVEDAGLVKIDILGNRSLAVIRDALDLVLKNCGRRIEYATLNPIDDPQTVRVFYEGNTFGVFYFESPATRQVLTKVRYGIPFETYLRMDHFLLNVVVTSIIRPASNPSIHTWVSRLHGEPWEPPHPLLRPVLEETLGVMVFQEQLSQAAIHLAGFDPAEADTLRKIVSKKHKQKKLRDFCRRFVQGAGERGASPEVIREVWQMMMGFDGYSFCKPHSASYTMVAYKSAFLRAHYPAEFMASVISNGGGYYAAFGYISEARRMGLQVLRPDINQSEIKYTGKDKAIRMGLMQLKDLSKEGMEAIIHERGKKGPFASLADFMNRTRPHVHLQDVRVLTRAGCFDAMAGSAGRPALVWEALRFYNRAPEPDQYSLPFKAASPSTPSNPAPGKHGEKRPRGEPDEDLERVRLRHELETFGFYLSVHPLDLYAHTLKRIRHVPAKDFPAFVGKRVTTVGWLVTGKTVHTKDGDEMKFVSFEDTTGIYETVFFPKIYSRFCHMLNAFRPFVLKGQVQETFGAVTLTVEEVSFAPTGQTGRSLPTLRAGGRTAESFFEGCSCRSSTLARSPWDAIDCESKH